jgi:hypothetical protein
VKTVQIQLKKDAKNKLKTLITNLGRLNPSEQFLANK